ncbi:MAG: hypothetical protein JWN72_1618 [Thermoleophilia bacterium]|nr:hypothetical protein [Thermoleophilia bacterium]
MPTIDTSIPMPATSDPRRRLKGEHIKYPAPGRPNILLDPDLMTRPLDQDRGIPDMPVYEIADRICAELLKGTGPIVICMPGTAGGGYQTSMLATSREMIKLAGGHSLSFASLPYPNMPIDIAKRFLGMGRKDEDCVLFQVLTRLKKYAGDRPIYVTGESLGAWYIADVLRKHPDLAAVVTRVALFAKPDFVKEVPSEVIGSAHRGARMMRATGAPNAVSATGIVEFRHTDDIVANLFDRLGIDVLKSEFSAIGRWISSGHYTYPPHHYEVHGADAARWLYLGERPKVTERPSDR